MKHAGASKAKKNEAKCKAYANRQARFFAKLKKVGQSCGIEAAKSYGKSLPCHAARYRARHGSGAAVEPTPRTRRGPIPAWQMVAMKEVNANPARLGYNPLIPQPNG